MIYLIEFDAESLLRAICAFLQIYLCLLANVFLLSIKCMFVCYQIYSHFYIYASLFRILSNSPKISSSVS